MEATALRVGFGNSRAELRGGANGERIFALPLIRGPLGTGRRSHGRRETCGRTPGGVGRPAPNMENMEPAPNMENRDRAEPEGEKITRGLALRRARREEVQKGQREKYSRAKGKSNQAFRGRALATRKPQLSGRPSGR